MHQNNRSRNFAIVVFSLLVFALSGCSEPDSAVSNKSFQNTDHKLNGQPYEKLDFSCNDQQPLRKALFGDLHVHTTYSFDVFSFGVQTTPADAYRFAKGETIDYLPLDESGKMVGSIQIDRPLDFVAVTDHAEFLGEYHLCMTENSEHHVSAYCTNFRKGGRDSIMATGALLALEQPQRIADFCIENNQTCLTASETPWQKIITAADNANDSSVDCSFSAMIAYEYTGSPATSNYHRNVVFRGANVPAVPVSYFEAPFDYQLWQALDNTCDRESGCDYLTIPHNSNLSNGKLLTPYANLTGNIKSKIDYANLRLAREPLMEIFQHKGNSECSNGFPDILGAPDELCSLEQFRTIGHTGQSSRVVYEQGEVKFEPPRENPTSICEPGKTGYGGMSGAGNGCLSQNDFYRSALLTGLREENAIGVNSVKLGASASTDTHMSTAGATREDQWRGHMASEWNREGRLSKPTLIPSGIVSNPGGLTGVWAIENSRDAIFDALQRREVFGTSGTRIKPRFFAGWNYPADLCGKVDMLDIAYAQGVPMGSDLGPAPTKNAAPTFFLAALADTREASTPLQKLQLIKGWIDAKGIAHNKVYDVAGDAKTTAGVDLKTGQRYGEGHASLCVVFTDPEFDAGENAYYYMRAVENPSPRWSMLDCLSDPIEDRSELCTDPKVFATINEQAWTSPIWVNNQ